MVVFVTSHFRSHAKDWWTHHRESYWVNDPWDPAGRQYQYPHWQDFVIKFKEQFHDPAVEEVHKKKMKELKMGSDTATVYFQKLEREASLAG